MTRRCKRTPQLLRKEAVFVSPQSLRGSSRSSLFATPYHTVTRAPQSGFHITDVVWERAVGQRVLQHVQSIVLVLAGNMNQPRVTQPLRQTQSSQPSAHQKGEAVSPLLRCCQDFDVNTKEKRWLVILDRGWDKETTLTSCLRGQIEPLVKRRHSFVLLRQVLSDSSSSFSCFQAHIPAACPSQRFTPSAPPQHPRSNASGNGQQQQLGSSNYELPPPFQHPPPTHYHSVTARHTTASHQPPALLSSGWGTETWTENISTPAANVAAAAMAAATAATDREAKHR